MLTNSALGTSTSSANDGCSHSNLIFPDASWSPCLPLVLDLIILGSPRVGVHLGAVQANHPPLVAAEVTASSWPTVGRLMRIWTPSSIPSVRRQKVLGSNGTNRRMDSWTSLYFLSFWNGWRYGLFLSCGLFCWVVLPAWRGMILDADEK